MINFEKGWTEENDELLLLLHTKYKMNIIEISSLFTISPNSIAYRLLEKGYLVENIHGYIEYTKTEECINDMKRIVSEIEKNKSNNII